MKPLSRKLAIGAVGLAALGVSAGVAVAATQTSTTPAAQAQAYLNDLAGKLGVTSSALTAAVKAADNDQIDAALAAGRLTSAEASALKARIQASTVAPLYGGGFAARRIERDGLGFGGADSAAAQYLGIAAATLRTDLGSGKSLAQLATAAPGKSVAGLEAAISAAETARLNAAVSSGQITSQQEQQRLSELSTRISMLVQGTRTGGHNWSRGGRSWNRSGATGASGSTLFSPTT